MPSLIYLFLLFFPQVKDERLTGCGSCDSSDGSVATRVAHKSWPILCDASGGGHNRSDCDSSGDFRLAAGGRLYNCRTQKLPLSHLA